MPNWGTLKVLCSKVNSKIKCRTQTFGTRYLWDTSTSQIGWTSDWDKLPAILLDQDVTRIEVPSCSDEVDSKRVMMDMLCGTGENRIMFRWELYLLYICGKLKWELWMTFGFHNRIPSGCIEMISSELETQTPQISLSKLNRIQKWY